MEKNTAVTFKLSDDEKLRFERAATRYMGGVSLSSFLRMAAHKLADTVPEDEDNDKA